MSTGHMNGDRIGNGRAGARPANTVSPLSGDELRERYRELILDHARSPRHFGRLSGATHEAVGINPLCGDRLHLYLAVDADGVVREAGFEGSGCAISVASASLMAEAIIGMDRASALARRQDVTRALRGESPGAGLGKLEALLGVREFPARVKCATLAWQALGGALTTAGGPVSTEN
jgi:nitrogen fixation NifU-like protein